MKYTTLLSLRYNIYIIENTIERFKICRISQFLRIKTMSFVISYQPLNVRCQPRKNIRKAELGLSFLKIGKILSAQLYYKMSPHAAQYSHTYAGLHMVARGSTSSGSLINDE